MQSLLTQLALKSETKEEEQRRETTLESEAQVTECGLARKIQHALRFSNEIRDKSVHAIVLIYTVLVHSMNVGELNVLTRARIVSSCFLHRELNRFHVPTAFRTFSLRQQ